MAQDLNETLLCWHDLPLANRRRLAVLLGRLALRRLPLRIPGEGVEGGMANEGGAEPRNCADATGQNPGASP
jgi:hypothetical protein